MSYKIGFSSLYITILLLCGAACQYKQDRARKTRSHGLSFEIKSLQDRKADSDATFYAARLVPDKDTITNPALKTALFYHMDSCFYMQNGKLKIYPKLVEMVNNGVPHSFEYLLTFDRTQNDKGQWLMVYQDKYLNHYRYTLPLNLE